MIELIKDGITMSVQTEGQASAFLNNGYKRVEAKAAKKVDEVPAEDTAVKATKTTK